jgi:hypothetical protein
VRFGRSADGLRPQRSLFFKKAWYFPAAVLRGDLLRAGTARAPLAAARIVSRWTTFADGFSFNKINWNDLIISIYERLFVYQ